MDAPTTIAPTSRVEPEVIRLRALQRAGGHEAARSGAEALLADFPRNRDLLLIAALSLRHQKRIPEALAMLDRLTEAHPRFSQAHQERGFCHIARKDAPGAIEALLRAVSLNPALPMSWRMLEGVYRLTGDTENAARAASQSAALAAQPPEVVRATAAFFDGDLAAAETIIRRFLTSHGDHPEAMRVLAKIALARDVLADADLLYESLLELAPEHSAARLEYGSLLVQRHKHAQALSQARTLLALDPRSLDYRALEASAFAGLGDHEAAIDCYRDLLRDTPNSPDLHLWLGHALKTVGRTPEAIDAYRAAAKARPEFGDAWWSLANLKTFRFADADIAAMNTAEAAPAIPAEDRAHLCFALGKAFEDRGEAGEAWRFYSAGNRIRRSASGYRPEILEENTAEQKRVCTPAFFAARTGWGAPAPDPILVVGLTRSGSTLLEQILASHSQVEGTQELSEIQRAVITIGGNDQTADDQKYPETLKGLTGDDFSRLGEAYITDTRAYRATARPFFIDKMPNNFRHIGLIHLMLPNAKIIDARREPMACCFSNLKQLFSRGQEFTYSIEDIARYYRTYLELMRHWDEVLPGKVLRVIHEDVVDDLEGQVRRILAHCGLAFEPACVAFHKTRRSVRTPSSEQVRQPIFRDGLEQWRRFEPWLGPLREALGDAVETWRD